MDSKSTESLFTFEQDDLLIRSMPILQDLRKTGLFCDVVIKAGDQEFQAHRNILAATIPYFYTMFTSEYKESKQREIIIKEMDPSIVEALIEFSYSGKINTDPQNVQKLMVAADFVQLNKVKYACADYLESKIQADNVFEIKKIANLLNCQQLVSVADEFLIRNFSQIGGMKEFLMLKFEDLSDLISKDDLRCNEDNVFEAAMKWVKHKEAERESHLTEILSIVRLSLISTEYLVNVVSAEKLIWSSLECLRIVDKAKNDRLIQGENSFTQKSRGLSKVSDLVPVKTENHIKFYDLIKTEWLDAELLIKNVSGFAIESIGCKIYVIGGTGRNKINVHIYDLGTKKWSNGKNMINERCNFGATTLNDCIYVCGGRQGSNYLSSVDLYSIKENSWKVVAPMLTQRTEVGVTSLNGHIYAIGGSANMPALRSCEKYDLASNTWSHIKPLSISRCGLGTATLNNKIYVCGGFNGNYLNTCEVYGPVTDTWEFVAPMNKERYLFFLLPINGKLYAVGGRSTSSESSSVTVEVYSPETNIWKMLNHIHL